MSSSFCRIASASTSTSTSARQNALARQHRQVTLRSPGLPSTLFRKRKRLFVTRIIFAISIIAGATACMMSGSKALFLAGLLVQGAMYVHLIELQHSVLHLQVFDGHRVNRAVGFFLGVPMLISFSEFQYKHLRHHKYLGTMLNTETFNYRRNELNSVRGFVKAMLDYSRLRTVAGRLVLAWAGKDMAGLQNPLMASRIRQEYRLFGIVLILVAVLCLVTSSPIPLLAWLAPLIAAEPVHFLLELPEHFGLSAHSNANVFENTRIWGGSWFARWFTHYTNFHLAHHFNQLVPMDNLPELARLLEDRVPESSRSKSYPHFFVEVMSGKIRADTFDPELLDQAEPSKVTLAKNLYEGNP